MSETRAAGVPPPQHFRASRGERLGVAAGASVLIALTIGAALLAVSTYAASAVLALVLGAIALAIGSLAGLVTREAVSRWRLTATIYAGRLDALLPRRRSFAPSDRNELSVAIRDIDRIETREEVFSSLGVTTSQRAYELVMTDGARHFLGADRAMLPPHFKTIVERLYKPVIDRGMVDGDAGFLLIAGVKVPDWSAPSLAPADIDRRIKARNRTPVLLLIAAAFTILARFVSGG
jgi:hypothetical protein